MTITEKRELCLRAYGDANSAIRNRIDADIEKYRKGRVRLTLRDKDGNPYSSKKITLKQTSHDFKYGANIFMLDEFESERDNAAYRDIFAKHFNLATVPFYWNDLEPERGKPRYEIGSPKIYRRPSPDLCVDYCEKSGILPKLHCLAYEGHLPEWLPKTDEAEMRRLYEKRFAEIASRYAGKMYEFEVINEILLSPGWNGRKSVLCDTRDFIEWCFALARKYFPNEILVMNECNQSWQLAHERYTSKYYMQLDGLLAKGTSIDKIGMQHHIFSGVNQPSGGVATDDEIKSHAQVHMNPEILLRALDILGEFDRPLEITEITVPTFGDTDEDEELQADILDMLYSTWFSHKNMESLVYWNVVDGTAWYTPKYARDENNCRGGLFHRDLTPKKSGLRLREMFNNRWHTDVTLTTSEDGVVEFDGFYGDYALEVEGKTDVFGLHKGMPESVILTV